MKKIISLFTLSFLIAGVLHAQEIKKYKIAIFTPLYLDSAFDATGNFRYEKTGARFVNAGLDFYYGAQLALDSLQKRGAPLDVFVYDSRGKQSISSQLAKPEMRDVDMILAQTNATETKLLAEAALRRKIPFISATFPNDAGVDNNPYFVILNTTLKSQVDGIYRFLQKYHSLDRIVMFTRPGTQEDLLKNYFNDVAKSTASTSLNIQFVNVGADYVPQTLARHLDSTKRTVVLAGSLDEAFATKLTQTLAGLNNRYPVRVIGMPTWENYNFTKANDLEIIYTTPFNYDRNAPLENTLATEYTKTMSLRPSDLFFRGYETTLRFGLLLLDTGKDVSSNLSRKGNIVFTQFDIQPVFKDQSKMSLDYFENKHLYFVKIFGTVKNILY
ncbi:MAG: ABC transporter substrate-binding protein [Flavisolibacter sp.]|nr:ABC transporter substrate-binding protein [Flavisolibacter sp.]